MGKVLLFLVACAALAAGHWLSAVIILVCLAFMDPKP